MTSSAVLRVIMCQPCQFGLALDQTDNRLGVLASDDRVSFPITEPRFLRHHLRTLVNGDAVGNLPPPRVTAIAFTPLFLATQVARERATPCFVRIDVLINALVADRGLLFEDKAS